MLKILILPLFLLPIQVTEQAQVIEELIIPKNVIIFDQETHRIAETIKYKETRGNCNARGADGEFSCWQLMPNTYKALTKKHLGEVKGYSTTTAELVVYKEIDELRLKNMPVDRIFLRWNAGNAKVCSRGITKIGKVPFDSCAYVKESMKIYNNMVK